MSVYTYTIHADVQANDADEARQIVKNALANEPRIVWTAGYREPELQAEEAALEAAETEDLDV